MLNSIAQLGSRLPEVIGIGNRTTAAMEQSVAERLRRAAEESGAELDAATLAAYSAAVVMTAQGLIQLSRLGTPLSRLREIAEVSSRNLPGAWDAPVAGGVA
jgi:TetR/AcrR family transcriptional repressor of nem operon